MEDLPLFTVSEHTTDLRVWFSIQIRTSTFIVQCKSHDLLTGKLVKREEEVSRPKDIAMFFGASGTAKMLYEKLPLTLREEVLKHVGQQSTLY